jgi:hypothetical protein
MVSFQKRRTGAQTPGKGKVQLLFYLPNLTYRYPYARVQ